ncbi:MAG: hypothetical protein K9H49_01100 [Bacteroidales bacterium]|nr:hypothetical protein [Bacteroidales bacterium]MCF8403794.1 hypothetical protein [Bacteroidales bacterium]
MKAYKQFSFQKEKKFLLSYAFCLIILGFTIMFSPVLAQDKESLNNEPTLRVEVKKEYDETGNLVNVDSTMIWSWNGIDFNFDQLDSSYNEWNDLYFDFFHKNQKPGLGFFGVPPGPPLHRFWDWNEDDSSAISKLDEIFEEKFSDWYDRNFFMPPQIDLNDTLNPGKPEDPNYTLREFNNKFEQHLQRMQEYMRERDALFDRYYGEPQVNIPKKEF